ncbi:hypothetical protein U9M48_010441 [Paspalum notatum var. saurae]|uniref:Uncharacterized protein n=1 Tax=Paspalum notatum var. saurae TaxID=547442 RepID=A0AAQ3WG95_PASNO
MTLDQVAQFAVGARGTLVLVLTDADVALAGFGSMRHSSAAWGTGYAYAWAGDAARQYAWPFATAMYGPQDSQSHSPSAPPTATSPSMA